MGCQLTDEGITDIIDIHYSCGSAILGEKRAFLSS
jgi:hypothetical protein